jgi:hypothetical protein
MIRFREETWARLGELREMDLIHDREAIIVHIFACDSLLLDQDVTAHREHDPADDAPNRLGPLPPKETEAWSSLVFANFHIVLGASKSLQKYIDELYDRLGTDGFATPHQLPEWEALVIRTRSALEALRKARYEGADRLENVVGCWPDLSKAILEARESYGALLDQEESKPPLTNQEKFIIAAFSLSLLLAWIIASRFI